jgi:UDP-glucose 4-epimerase
MNVLVTGGAGYIGSHAALRLVKDGHNVTVIDNLSRGHASAIDQIARLGAVHFQHGSVGDRGRVESLLRSHSIDTVLHFAAKAYVGESVEQPLEYYRNNTADALSLIEAMDAAGIRRMIFSSTCATYGEPDSANIPIAETCPQHPINPYGWSKRMVEQILFDYADMKRARGEDFAFAALRYFNVAGCSESGRIGEDHKPETHLIPICLEVALGQREHVRIFGTDYPTPDGTCIRDYVHVDDLIDAHLTTLRALKAGEARVYNVGIGFGYSVRDIVEACRRVTGAEIPAIDEDRRPGDPPTLFADPTRIKCELGWEARHTSIDDIIATAWAWKKVHPYGYASVPTSAANR